MDLLHKFYSFIMNWNLPNDNFDPDKVYCMVDGKVVSCETWEECEGTYYGKMED